MKEAVVPSNEAYFCVIIDRIEGNYAVCEFPDMSMRDIELSKIPFEVKEKNTLVVKTIGESDFEVICKKKVIVPKKRNPRLTRFV